MFATRPELHPDVSALQRPVLFLEVSATGPELHLDVSAIKRNVLLLEVSTLQGPELYLDVSALQRNVCNQQGLVHAYCRTCSLRFENNLLTVERIRFASKIIFLLSKVFALLRK